MGLNSTLLQAAAEGVISLVAIQRGGDKHAEKLESALKRYASLLEVARNLHYNKSADPDDLLFFFQLLCGDKGKEVKHWLTQSQTIPDGRNMGDLPAQVANELSPKMDSLERKYVAGELSREEAYHQKLALLKPVHKRHKLWVDGYIKYAMGKEGALTHGGIKMSNYDRLLFGLRGAMIGRDDLGDFQKWFNQYVPEAERTPETRLQYQRFLRDVTEWYGSELIALVGRVRDGLDIGTEEAIPAEKAGELLKRLNQAWNDLSDRLRECVDGENLEKYQVEGKTFVRNPFQKLLLQDHYTVKDLLLRYGDGKSDQHFFDVMPENLLAKLWADKNAPKDEKAMNALRGLGAAELFKTYFKQEKLSGILTKEEIVQLDKTMHEKPCITPLSSPRTSMDEKATALAKGAASHVVPGDGAETSARPGGRGPQRAASLSRR